MKFTLIQQIGHVEDCGGRSKKENTVALSRHTDLSLLPHAKEMSLWANGKLKASKMVKDITANSPSNVERLYKSFSKPSAVTHMSTQEALPVLAKA